MTDAFSVGENRRRLFLRTKLVERAKNMPTYTNDPVSSTCPGVAVRGESQEDNGLLGISHHPANAAVSAVNVAGGLALWAESKGGGAAAHFEGRVDVVCPGIAVYGHSTEAEGVRGVGDKGAGVSGTSEKWVGVYGESQENNGVLGISHHPANAAVSAVNVAGGLALWAESKGSADGAAGVAAQFYGRVDVVGDLQILNGHDVRLADFAEDFDVAGGLEIAPGCVVVLHDEVSVQQSQNPYDRRVAGVVSGAGNFRAAITLDRDAESGTRIPIALLGKVFCKVDAQFGAIATGDLLTTSATPGHAMKADDPTKAFGSVIGKALRPLEHGRGLIPILIALK